MRANLHTMRAGIPTTAALRRSLCARRDLLLEILALRHQLGSFVVQIDVFAIRTGYSGCACDGGGLGGRRRSYWSSRRRRPVASSRAPWMLEPPTAAATGQAMYRRTASSADSAYGHGEPALGHSADPRRVAETRTRRLERTVSRYLPDRRRVRHSSSTTSLLLQFGWRRGWKELLANHSFRRTTSSDCRGGFSTAIHDS